MKERPVIFNGEMVRAILDGRKTQTRRTLTDRQLHLIDVASQAGECYPLESGIDHANSQSYYREHCPFGQVGDRLWVREAFQGPLIPEDELSEYLGANPDKFQSPAYCEYAADGGAKPEYVDSDENTRYGWRPSIHMPRWASRITLEITGVRVERLQDISESDAIAEGGTKHFNIDWFGPLWASIYGEESWGANPWVWVIEFKRVEAQHG
ncbi:TPA: morphogenetic protein [Serratia marcescens]